MFQSDLESLINKMNVAFGVFTRILIRKEMSLYEVQSTANFFFLEKPISNPSLMPHG